MKNIKQAVILAGGEGIRLRPLTLSTPKPMIPINGKPFLEYIIQLLKENGIEEVVILTGYLHEKIEDYFEDGEKFGLKIKYSCSPVEADTGTRVKNAKDFLSDSFLLLYGDNYWPLNLKKLTEFYEKVGAEALVTIYCNMDSYTKNNMLVSNNGLVEVYDKARETPGLNGVDIGFFILKKSILENLPKENFSFERVIMPKLIEKKQLAGFLTYHKYYGLSNLERIPLIEEFFKPKKIVLLDRDGVINKKPPKADYVKNWSEFEFLPGAVEGLKLLSQNNYHVFILTNQPGIARGVMTKEDLTQIHEKMQSELQRQGIKIDEIYHCPHGWDEDCFCRKPKPGMLFRASADHHFDLTKTIFIGDDERDKEAGEAAGCEFMQMQQDGNLLETVKNLLTPV